MPNGLSAADMAAVKEVAEANVRLVEKGDLKGWLRLFTPNAVSMPAGRPAVKGHAGLAELFKAHLDKKRTVFSEAQVDGREDMALFVSHLTIQGGAPDGGDLKGKHLLKLLKQPDGGWLISFGIYNFDSPATV